MLCKQNVNSIIKTVVETKQPNNWFLKVFWGFFWFITLSSIWYIQYNFPFTIKFDLTTTPNLFKLNFIQRDTLVKSHGIWKLNLLYILEQKKFLNEMLWYLKNFLFSNALKLWVYTLSFIEYPIRKIHTQLNQETKEASQKNYFFCSTVKTILHTKSWRTLKLH